MNKLGYMHGSKETAKGKAAEKKHRSHHDNPHSKVKLRGLGGEIKRPATRSKKQGHSFAENMNHGGKY
jgi:hypothetical protein